MFVEVNRDTASTYVAAHNSEDHPVLTSLTAISCSLMNLANTRNSVFLMLFYVPSQTSYDSEYQFLKSLPSTKIILSISEQTSSISDVNVSKDVEDENNHFNNRSQSDNPVYAFHISDNRCVYFPMSSQCAMYGASL